MLNVTVFDVCCIIGLDNTVAGYADCFAQAEVTGRRLLMLTNDDLELIGINKLGHQEVLLQSIALLQALVRLVCYLYFISRHEKQTA